MKLDFDNKFYNVPKKHSQIDPYNSNRSPNQGKSRMLDYQSSSKFKLV